MPKQSYGSTSQTRARTLLLALLDFANDSLETADESQLDSLRSHIQVHWQSEKQLVVRTKARYLEALVKLTGQTLSIDQIKTALKQLENFLRILTDNRTAQRGSDNWHFTLMWWSDRWQRAENSAAFDRAWVSQRAMSDSRSEVTIPAVIEEPLPSPSIVTTGARPEFWSQLCRSTLNTQLSSNPLTAQIGKSFEVSDIYMPLGVRERPNLTSDEEPEDPRSYQLPELLMEWQSAATVQRIAIVGEPGIGKTTFLQKIALSLLDHQLPIWISLADLGEQSIGDYLTQTWLAEALQTYIAPPEQQISLTEVCQQGRVWLLLDAVDEMAINPSLALTQLAKQLRGWLTNVHIILTCRLNVWDGDKNALVDFRTYQSLGFDQRDSTEHTRAFIQHWFKPQPAMGLALQQELQRPDLWSLQATVQNPLCLALLCRTWALTQGKLPATKATLYRQFVDALYAWKQELFPTTRTQRQQLNLVLAQMAWQGMQQPQAFRLAHELVASCCDAIDPDLMTLALQLGWLKSVSISSSGDKVYAFSHPTFQEYFAAQAVDDGLCLVGKFPVIKWQEVMMLWLGRVDIPDQQKESLLSALVNFDDRVGGFYSYRTYFLAAEGLAEFPGYSGGAEVVAQLVQWRFGHADPTLPTVLVERAGMALSRSARSLTIPALENFLSVAKDPLSRWLAAHSLGKNHDPGNQQAIDTLQALLSESIGDQFRVDVARSLGTINPGNRMAINTLTDLITAQPYPALQRRAAQRLGRIDPGNSFAQQTLERLVTEVTDPHLKSMTVKTLEQLAESPWPGVRSKRSRKSKPSDSHHLSPAELITILAAKIPTTKDPLGRIRLARRIAYLDPAHPQGLGNLLQYFADSMDKVEIKMIGESLRELILVDDEPTNLNVQLSEIFAVVRDVYLSPTSGAQYQESFKLLWYWSRRLSYQEFLQLWQC